VNEAISVTRNCVGPIARPVSNQCSVSRKGVDSVILVVGNQNVAIGRHANTVNFTKLAPTVRKCAIGPESLDALPASIEHVYKTFTVDRTTKRFVQMQGARVVRVPVVYKFAGWTRI